MCKKNGHFIEEKIQMAKRYTYRCSILEARKCKLKHPRDFYPLIGKWGTNNTES